ncbi:MAG TPA: phosphatase PAP2 family protein [Jatrophihabitantaceae bacterium]|nr:phosphatase PAP2 family protein [Jatrophihabitantaceae bacterium]
MDQLTQARRVPARTKRVPWRAIAFAGLLIVYVLLILGVVHRSPLITMDRDIWHLNLRARWPQWWSFLNTYVMLGQRAPSTIVALPWFIWMCWRFRSARPLLTLGTALVVLNISVGVVKVATGRQGPRQTHKVYDVFAGGDIFPSGHTANTVALYGVIAMVACYYRVQFHKLVTIGAVFLSLTVGLCTIYLDTHWLTDVLGGWVAGGLVLLALPTIMPYAERVYDAVARRIKPRLRRLRRVRPIAIHPLRVEQLDGPGSDSGRERVPAQL